MSFEYYTASHSFSLGPPNYFYDIEIMGEICKALIYPVFVESSPSCGMATCMIDSCSYFRKTSHIVINSCTLHEPPKLI